MESRIEHLKPKKLIGLHMEMSLSDNQTAVLWQTFMPRRNEIISRLSADFISMQVYDQNQDNIFSPETPFIKWAAVEVRSHDQIPDGMQSYTLKGGTYAVFIHKGPASEFPKTMHYIIWKWIPESDYELDKREHFERLPKNYNPVSADATEEVWIPVRKLR